MKDVGGAVLAGSSPPFRERAADLDDDGEKVGFIENTARRHRWGG